MKKAQSALIPAILISFLCLKAARAQGPADPLPESPSSQTAPTASRPTDRQDPPGLGKQILGGVAYGAGWMLAGGLAGAGLFSVGCAEWGEDCGFATFGGAFFGGMLGFSAGFPFGVHRYGTDETTRGSLAWTYASAALGGAVAFGGSALATGFKDEDARFQSILIGMAGAPIGALIGFNLTRGPRSGVPRAALAPLPDGGWAGRLTWSFR